MSDWGSGSSDVGPALGRARPGFGFESERLKGAIAQKLGIEAAPATVGRFAIKRRVGSGAIGLVYAAHDPELDREVAVKVLRSATSVAARRRFVREAQAMAALSHPNVVDVYDVGLVDTGAFIAMEYVDGMHLRAWLAERDRPWRDVLGIFVQAGRGLAAAHHAGLVHRDFKPENVLVGADGRVRVVDFGLARGVLSSAPSPESDSEAIVEEQRSLDPHLTQQGTVVGTPAYMSPEQQRAEDVGPATDQYSFCVALYEGLYGARPSVAQSTREIPRGLDRIVRRGLEPAPNERWKSMDALLDALESRTKSRRALFLAAGALVAGVGVTLWATGERRSCEENSEGINETWDMPTREALQRVFAADADAADVWSDVDARVQAYVAEWREAHVDACRAPTGELDRRLTCLRRRRVQLQTLVDAFGEATSSVLQRAPETLESLPPPRKCNTGGDHDEHQRPLPDDDLAPAVDRVRDHIAEGVALEATGQYKRALTRAFAVADEAEATGFQPVIAEATLRVGELAWAAGEFDISEEWLVRAHHLALTIDHEVAAAEAASQLVFLVGVSRMREQEGREWIRHASAAVARLGPGSPVASHFDQAAGVYYLTWGDYSESERHLERLLERLTRDNSESLPVASALVNLGNVARQLSGPNAAREYYARAAAIYERLQGPESSGLGIALSNLVTVMRPGDPKRVETATRSVAIMRSSMGDDHPDIGLALQNLGVAQFEAGHLEEARATLSEALEHKERTRPDVGIAPTLATLGRVLQESGELDAAIAHHERAIALVEAGPGRSYEDWASIQRDFADTLAAMGDHERAVEHYAEAVRALADSPGYAEDRKEIQARIDQLQGLKSRSSGQLDSSPGPK